MNTLNITLDNGEEIRVVIDNLVIESDTVGAWDNEFRGYEILQSEFDINAIAFDMNNFTQEFSEQIEEEVKEVIKKDYWEQLEKIYEASCC